MARVVTTPRRRTTSRFGSLASTLSFLFHGVAISSVILSWVSRRPCARSRFARRLLVRFAALLALLFAPLLVAFPSLLRTRTSVPLSASWAVTKAFLGCENTLQRDLLLRAVHLPPLHPPATLLLLDTPLSSLFVSCWGSISSWRTVTSVRYVERFHNGLCACAGGRSDAGLRRTGRGDNALLGVLTFPVRLIKLDTPTE